MSDPTEPAEGGLYRDWDLLQRVDQCLQGLAGQSGLPLEDATDVRSSQRRRYCPSARNRCQRNSKRLPTQESGGSYWKRNKPNNSATRRRPRWKSSASRTSPRPGAR